MNKQDFATNVDEALAIVKSIVTKKNADYSGYADDALANIKSSVVLGINPVSGVLIRTLDKLKRIQTFASTGTLAVNESAKDSILDVIGYMLLLYCLLREEQCG